MANTRILVVEDEPDVCAALQAFLGRRGYDVVTTSRGVEAVSLITSGRSDLVLLDMTLEGMNGFEVLQELRRNRIQIRVIVITGQLWDEGKLGEMQSLGVVAVVHKPVSLSRLEELLGAIVEKKPSFVLLPAATVSFFDNADDPDVHAVFNLLGVIRNSCESFVLDDDEGFHQGVSANEIRSASTRVMRGVIEHVDHITRRMVDDFSGGFQKGSARRQKDHSRQP